MLIKAVQDYYDKLGIHYEESDILITTGGSEALQMLMLSILDDGSEVIIPEPFYPNYNTFIKSAGGTIRLKTAVINLAHTAEQKGEPLDKASLAASFCRAMSESLVPRTMAAVRELGYEKLAVAGGVAANSRIRGDFQAACDAAGIRLFVPPLKLCGDNAAMIGCQAYYEYLRGARAGSELNAWANMEISEVPFYGRA